MYGSTVVVFFFNKINPEMLMTDVKGSKLKVISGQFVGCISNNSVILNQQAGPEGLSNL